MHFADYFLGNDERGRGYLLLCAPKIASKLGKSLDELTVDEFLQNTTLRSCDNLCDNMMFTTQRDDIREYLTGIWGNWRDLEIE